MTPEPYPSMLEQADEYDIAAEKANKKGDYLYEALLKLQASTLRSQAVAAKSREIVAGRVVSNTPCNSSSSFTVGED